MDTSVWLSLFVLFFAGGLTPGPAVLLVVSTSLKHGFRPAMLPAIGVSAANLVWITLAAAGVAALAATLPVFFAGLKLSGIAFILFLAWRIVRAGPQDLRQPGTPTPGRAGLFASGFGLQLANPNALVFFGLILPSYFDASRPVLPQVLAIMVTITATEMTGLALYAGLSDALARRFANPGFARRFSYIAASLMVISALYAVWSTR